jgi:phosphatidylserine/phosphatidylglycerophosphate/cardiolipin synthase-like enzyme
MIRLTLAIMLLASPALADPSITVAFSPHGGATEAVVQVISAAEHSIHLAGYGFTSRPIAQALIAAHGRGVEVDAVLDKSNATARFTEAGEVAAADIPVRIDSRYAIMHDKFLVVDGVTVETGSFNFTRAAEFSNAENVIVLRNAPDVAARYEQEWQRLWDESAAWTKP